MNSPAGEPGPAFSVVMATYNRGRHILPSIRSVLQQRYQDFELIVVGDCCTDETEDAVRPFLSDRVRWFNLAERCGSQSFPNNEGIARSRGRYIAYLGHDDIWTPDHLLLQAGLFQEDVSLDFAVGGGIYHGPPGSDYRVITGLPDAADAPSVHFFPPSSVAHRRDVTDRIGPWAHPMGLAAPVDADFQLRAARAGMRFRSTQAITLHKFAAGHRYLSYVAPDSSEQEEVLSRFGSPDYDASIVFEVERAKAQGRFLAAHHIQYENFEKGSLAKNSAIGRGIIRPALNPLRRREVIVQDNLPRALDWKEMPDAAGRIRWVNLNPRPKILIPYSHGGEVRIDFAVAHPDAQALGKLAMSVNGVVRETALSPPRPNGSIFEATATVLTPLRQRDFSIVELQLTEAQRPNSQREGIGVGEIVLTPTGWQRLAGRARSFAGRIRRRLAG